MQERPSGERTYWTPASRILGVALAVCLLLVGSVASSAPLASCEGMGEEIRNRYESRLETLSLSKQRHFSQRLYRITGNEKYLPWNLPYARQLLGELRVDIAGLNVPGYALVRSRQVVEDYGSRTEKQRARKKMLGEWGEIAYAKNLAFRLVQAKYYGLLDEAFLPGYERALDYLASLDFQSFLTDPEVFRVYSAQVANQLYYLHELGVADYREQVIAAFRERYPPSRDAELSKAEYRNKIYGMTHFVIAASRYYQQPVDSAEFSWVLKEFEANLERILQRTKEDIYTEVALSFLLAGKSGHEAVERIKLELAESYDPHARMVPSEEGVIKGLAAGEHRNVLAIMLFCWPHQPHAGPDLSGSLPRQSE